MEFDFKPLAFDSRVTERRNWAKYYISLGRHLPDLIVLIGTSMNRTSIYSSPETLDTNFYNLVSIYCDILYSTRYDATTLLSLSIYNDVMSYHKSADYFLIPIELLVRILEHFNIIDASYYCDDCGIKLLLDEKLCWACRHGI